MNMGVLRMLRAMEVHLIKKTFIEHASIISQAPTFIVDIKVCLNRYSWGAGKVGSEYSSWFIRLECISPVQICM